MVLEGQEMSRDAVFVGLLPRFFSGKAPLDHGSADVIRCQHEFGLQLFPTWLLHTAAISGMIGIDRVVFIKTTAFHSHQA